MNEGGEKEGAKVLVATKRGRETPGLPRETFADIHTKILSEDTPDEEREVLVEKRDQMMGEAEETGAVNWRDVKRSVLNRIKKNRWDDVYPQLIGLARSQEGEARGAAGFKPEFEGMVEAAVTMAALEVSTQGKRRREGDPEFEHWLAKHATTIEELERDEGLIERGRILDFRGIKLPDLVGESIAKEEERAWESGQESLSAQARTAEAAERMAEKQEKRVEGVPFFEPKENTPVGWTTMVFEKIGEAERNAEEKDKRSDEDEEKIWTGIKDAIRRLAESGEYETELKGEKDKVLSRLYPKKYPEGVYLKEKLEIYLAARRRLNDRFIEVQRAGGSLIQLGVGAEKVPLEGVRIKLTNIRPMDWWLIIHGDEIFQPEVQSLPAESKERKEVLVNIDEALCDWWEVGSRYYDDRKGIRKYFEDIGGAVATPTVKESLNSDFNMSQLRSNLRRKLESKGKSGEAERIAFRILAVSRSLALFDRDRASIQGQQEDRDLMHFSRQRVNNFIKKGRRQIIEWTVGRYFALPAPVLKKIKREPVSMEPKVLKRRKGIVDVNAGRAVFQVPEGFCQGQIVGDFFNTTTLEMEDELITKEDREKGRVSSIYRKLISWAVDSKDRPIRGGWKRIPFERLGPESYKSYFDYSINIANEVSNEWSGGLYKEEEMLDPGFWAGKRTLFDRLDAISPWFNSLEYDFRGAALRTLLRESGEDFSQKDIDRIRGFSGAEDIAHFSPDQRTRIQELLLDPEVREGIANKKREEKLANKFKVDHLDKLTLVHALGSVWQGSLDRIEGIGGVTDRSAFNLRVLAKIHDAMEVGRYLPNSQINRLRGEEEEMGFGSRWHPAVRKEKRKY